MNVRNHVQLVGNLGADPEMKRFENGKVRVSLNLAVSNSYRNNLGQQISETQWHRINAWGRTAENMGRLLRKGTQIAVFGKLETTPYEAKDGVKKYFTSIFAHDFLLVNTTSE